MIASTSCNANATCATTTTTFRRRAAGKSHARGVVLARASSASTAADASALYPRRELAQVSAKKVAAAPVAKPSVPSAQIAVGSAVAIAAAALAIKASKSSTIGGASKQKRIVIAGAPASGKGTQCEMIVKKFGLTHISAGDLLRAAVAAGTDAGKKAKEYMDRGDLVPNEVVVTMVKDRLAQPDCAKGWLLDGYPRSEEQAEALIESGIDPDLFLLLDVPDESLLVKRGAGGPHILQRSASHRCENASAQPNEECRQQAMEGQQSVEGRQQAVVCARRVHLIDVELLVDLSEDALLIVHVYLARAVALRAVDAVGALDLPLRPLRVPQDRPRTLRLPVSTRSLLARSEECNPDPQQ